MTNILINLLLLANLLFTPTRIPIVSPKDEDKSSETLAKESEKRKCFELLSKELHDKFGFYIEKESEWPNRQPEIYYITYYVHYFDKIDSQEDARELAVKSVSHILDFLNNNSDAAQLLVECPFTSERILFFNIKFIPNLLSEQGWCSVTVRKGVVHYTYIYDQVKVPSETFEEAKAKVEASSR